MNSNEFMDAREWVWESHLVTRLGLNRDALRELRERLLKNGPDWRVQHNRILISRAGVEKLGAHLSAAAGSGEAQASKPGLDTVLTVGALPGPTQEAQRPVLGLLDWPAKTAVLHVWRTFPKNRHIIEAFQPGTDPAVRANVVRVKVRDASRFARYDHLGKPMAIECRHIQVDFWEHTGPLPRKKGRF